MKSDPPLAPNFISSLLAWYDANAREMPWRLPHAPRRRKRPDPYAVLVSEIMLQQTTVKAVIPYYERWMERFPTVADLARAGAQTVLRQWEGLGYYSRAGNLHAAARKIVSRYGGKIPQDVVSLRSLPGVGEYTADAVASIAFGLPEPALDANSRRVWSRLLATPDKGRIRVVFARVLPRGRPGDFNQALMDLGSAVCLPRDPVCTACPVSRWCRACKSGEPGRYPAPKKRHSPVAVEAALGILFYRGKILVQKRADKGLFPGMWEFPGGRMERAQDSRRRARGKPVEAPEEAVVREMREETGLAVRVTERFGVFKHSYTRFSVALHVFLCEREGGHLSRSRGARWATIKELDGLPMPAANRRIVEKLKNEFLAD